MRATIEDLRKGDTVIIPIGSVLAEVKLLRQPQLAKTGKKTTWYGKARWTSVLCAIRYDNITYKSANSNHTWSKDYPVIAGDLGYNREKRIDFTDKIGWIIKRES